MDGETACIVCGKRATTARFCGRSCSCFWVQTQRRKHRQEHFAEIFLTKVEQGEGCWLWNGTRHQLGYGVLSVGDKMKQAHRVAYEIASGEPLSPGVLVLHTCDNKPCVRNDEPGTYVVNGQTLPRFGHLFLGTSFLNSADMVAKGRQARGDATRPDLRAKWARNGMVAHPESRLVGELHWKAKLTWADVERIRRLYASGEADLARLAEEYTVVTRPMLARIVRGEAWVRPGDTVPNLGRGHRRGPDGRMLGG